MNETKTSVFSNGLIWFGAAVSISEIFTGTLIAPLGLKKGLAAIVMGHIIGCILLYFAGLIGAKSGKSSMETVKMSFGQKGSVFFSALNIIQLLGWTAVMIISGAAAVQAVVGGGTAIWCLVIGALIIVWVLVDIRNLGKLNLVVMGGLFLLTVVLSVTVFRGGTIHAIGKDMSMGSAVELSVAMPLSWLPLISDYTKSAGKPKTATAVSAFVYFLASCWMYTIGLGAAIFTGESDISRIMLSAGLGLAAVYIIIAATVTTTFLDVYSAGVSFLSITRKTSKKTISVITCIAGAMLAILAPISQYENFLYLIGSVFAPMTAILITDFFILKKNHMNESVNIANAVIWAAGFAAYRMMLSVDTIIGSTLPVMFITAFLCIAANFVKNLLSGTKPNELEEKI